MRGEAGLLADLGALAIPFAAYEHQAVFTVAESDAVNAAIPGAHTKNLFLKDNGAAPGTVTPLAAINAPPGSIAVVLDAGLASAETVNVHPLRNTGTLGLAGATILDLLRHWGHQPLVAAIPVQDPV